MPKITFIEAGGQKQLVDIPVGTSIMEAARDNGVPGIDADCGGVCACATCHVFVTDAWRELVGPPSEDEAEMVECATDPRENSRLSCQIMVTEEMDGLVLELPVTQR